MFKGEVQYEVRVRIIIIKKSIRYLSFSDVCRENKP